MPNKLKHGSIPSAWLTISWSPETLLRLLEEVDRRGIAHNDMAAVRRVAAELTTNQPKETK